MNIIWLGFQQTLALEIGNELAQQFVSSLFEQSRGDIKIAGKKYFDIGISWAPVIMHWRNWIVRKALSPPVIVMRDAKPLTVVPIACSWPQVWLNRKSCGIPDEISRNFETIMDPLVSSYLEQHHLDHPFTFVDSGCWGTIVKELHSHLGLKFQPLFFFSHNPWIPGFLNELGIENKYGEILNDSFECCFPNAVIRPSSFSKEKSGLIVPNLKETDYLSEVLGKMVLDGVRIGAASFDDKVQSAADSVQNIIELSQKAECGEFTGILSSNSPTWSEGDKFLSEWPKELCWT